MSAPALTEVSREAPPGYERLSPMLTPVEAVLPGCDIFPESDEGGVVLLSERLVSAEDDGSLLSVYHSVSYTRNEAGVPYNERDTFTFDGTRQSIHLIEAYTLDEQGRRTDVADNAVFIHSPQNGASKSLYTSDEEMVIIFPGVRKGVVTVATIALVTHRSVIDGQFTTNRFWIYGWPLFRNRLLIDLPRSMRDRLSFINTSSAVPAMTESDMEGGRVRLEWVQEAIDGRDGESNAPAWEFTVPTVWISTMPDWNALSNWYWGLAADRGTPGDALKRAIDEATSGIRDEDGIIRALTTLASDKVRYVGLEFGTAGYQPYDCNEVWANGYGDCKDKANLLVAMLRYKGIQAWHTLLDTTSHGLVEKRSPSPHQFDHMIVAVPRPDAPTLFIDATVKFLPPGLLPDCDQGRDVLLITDNGAVWERTPVGSENSYTVICAIDVGTDGRLSGWFKMDDGGVSAASSADRYMDLDPDALRELMQNYARQFIAGSRAFDADWHPVEGPVEAVSVRAFIETEPDSNGARSILFPFPQGWLPSIPARQEREQPYILSTLRQKVIARYKLPAGLGTGSLPEPLRFQSEAVNVESSWRIDEDGILVAELDWQPQCLILTAEQYGMLARAVRTLIRWLSQPVLISPSAEAPVAQMQPEAEELDFPLLATGPGQLRLLEQRYPQGKNNALRRKALERIIQWFADDPATVGEAEITLAVIEWNKDEQTAATVARQIEESLGRYGPALSSAVRSWAEYMHALAAYRANKDPSAIDELVRLMRDPQLSPFRRGWSGYAAAQRAFDSDNERALSLAEESLKFDSPVSDNLRTLRCEVILKIGDLDRIKALLRESASTGGDTLAGFLGELSRRWLDLDASQREALLAEMGALDTFSTDNAKTLEELTLEHRRDAAQQRLAAGIRSILEKEKPDWWQPDSSANGMPIGELEEQIFKQEGLTSLKLAVPMLLRKDAGYARFTRALSGVTSWLRSTKAASSESLLTLIDQEIESMPPDDEGYIIRVSRGLSYWLWPNGRRERAVELLKKTLEGNPERQWAQVEAADRLISLLLENGDAAGALEGASKVQDKLSSYRYSTDIVITQILLLLQKGDFEGAGAALDRFASLRKDWIKDSDYSVIAEHLDGDAAKRQALKEYWEHSKTWWPEWVALCGKHGVAPETTDDLLKMRKTNLWSENVKTAVEQRGAPGFLEGLRPIVQSLRLFPTPATDLYRQNALSADARVGLAREFTDFYDKIARDWHYGDPATHDSIRSNRAALLIDNGRAAEGLDASREIYGRLGTTSWIGRNALRNWLIAARKLGNTDEVVAEVERVLAQEGFAERGDLVRALSDTYYLSKNEAAQKQMLEREIPMLDEKTNAETLKVLRARRDELEPKVDASTYVRAWIDRNCREWFESAWPTTLEGFPRVQNGEPSVGGESDGVTAKAYLLHALEEGLAEDVSAGSVAIGASKFLEHGIHPLELPDHVAETLDDTGLPIHHRVGVLLRLSSLAVHREDPVLLRALLASKATDNILGEFLHRIRAHLAFIEDYRSATSDDLPGLMRHFAEVPIDEDSALLIRRLAERLVYLGETEKARAVFAASSKLKASSSISLSSLRLQLANAIREAESRLEFNNRFRELVFKEMGPAPEEEPALFRCFAEGSSYATWMPHDDSRACALYAIKTGRLKNQAPEDYLPWLSHPDNDAAWKELCAQTILLALDYKDDEPKTVLRLGLGLKFNATQSETWRQSLASRLQEDIQGNGTKARVKQLEWVLLASDACANSEEAAPPILFNPPPTLDLPKSMVDAIKLDYLLARGLLEPLRTTLENMSLIEMDSPELQLAYSSAYAAVGHEMEADLAREAAVEGFQKLLRSQSLLEDMEEAFKIPALAWVLDLPEEVSPALEKLLREKIRDESSLACEFLFLQMARGEWEAALHSMETASKDPREGDKLQGVRAIILAHLGRIEEAKEHFVIFEKTGRNGFAYAFICSEFRKLLAELEP